MYTLNVIEFNLSRSGNEKQAVGQKNKSWVHHAPSEKRGVETTTHSGENEPLLVCLAVRASHQQQILGAEQR